MTRKPVRRLVPVVAALSLVGGLLAAPLALPAASSGSASFANAGVPYVATANNSLIILAGTGNPGDPPIAQPECADGVNNDLNAAPEGYPPNYQDNNADQGAPQSPTPAADAECDTDTTGGRGFVNNAGTTASAIVGRQTSGGSAKAWVVNRWSGQFVRMVTGAQAGQVRQISSNTATTLTLASALPGIPANNDLFIIQDASGSELGADSNETQDGYQPKVPINLTATIGANGTIQTAGSSVTFPQIVQYTQVSTPLAVNGATVVTVTATLKSGDINTDTGATTVTVTLGVVAAVPVLGNCTIPNFDVTLSSAATPGVNDGPIPVPKSNYDASTGLVSVGNNTFTIPGSTGGILGLCSTSFNNTFGLPAPVGKSVLGLGLKLQPASGNAQPIANVPTVSPAGPYTEGQTVTLNGSGTDTDLVPCVTGGTVPGTGCNGAPPPNEYKWTQTAGPPVSWINGATGQNPQLVIPDQGTYTFLEQVQDGSTKVEAAPVTQTVTFSATSVQPTANAGPDIALVAGGATGKLTGSSTDPAPADPEANRQYSWANTGGTCGANQPTLSASNVKSPTVTPPASVPTPCYTDFTLTTTATSDTGPGGTDIARVTVRPPAASGTITGVVYGCTNPSDQNTCSPLAGVNVRAFSAVSPGATLIATSPPSAGDGSFTISGLTDGTQYRLKYVKPPGTTYQAVFFGGGIGAGSLTVTAPNSAADQNMQLLTANKGTITGTVTVQGGGNAPDGTPVRLYNSHGYVGRKLTAGGSYTFSDVGVGNDYYLSFNMGATGQNQYNWSGPAPSGVPGARSQGTAVKQTVTAGNTTTLNAELLTNELVVQGTLTSGGTGGALGDTTKAWTPNQWAGYQVRWVGAKGAGRLYTIRSNTATTLQLTNKAALPSAPTAGSAYQIFDPLVRATGTASAGATATTVTQGSDTWVVNQWAGGGYQLRIQYGPGLGQVRDIASNTATQITVGTAFSPAPNTTSVFQIEKKNATGNAQLDGTVFRADTGGPVAAYSGGVGVETRIYTTTGAFLGKVQVGAPQVLGTFGGVGRNYTFQNWNPGTGTVQGISPGNYKVLFRVVGALTDGAGRTFCSTWATNTSGAKNAVGGPGAGSFAFAPVMSVNPAALNILNVSLSKSATVGGSCTLN